MPKKRILWIDDEIEGTIKSQVLSLGIDYDVVAMTNGQDGINEFIRENFDAVILDQQMPGMQGVEVLGELLMHKPYVPVIMCTKENSEDVVEEVLRLGAMDFICKPFGPNQLKFTLKRLLDLSEIQVRKLQEEYSIRQRTLSLEIGNCRAFSDWTKLYSEIVDWEVKLAQYPELSELILELKREANESFCKFIKNNFECWLAPQAKGAPLLSHRILSDYVKPLIAKGEKVALVVIDNFRLDQWKVIRDKVMEDGFDISDDLYCSILPTATQYSRNAIFAGLLPKDIKRLYRDYWVDGSDDESQLNAHERELLAGYFERQRLKWPNSYYKVGSDASGEEYIRRFGGYKDNKLNALVFSFIDALSHKGADLYIINELIHNDSAYRSITLSWYQNGSIRKILNLLAENGYTIVLTTDHGTIRVDKSVEISGSQSINANMRYKLDNHLRFNAREAFEVEHPENIGVPPKALADHLIFALNRDFFIYQNNQKSDIVKKYVNSFQHGGISLEEMILPLITLRKRQ